MSRAASRLAVSRPTSVSSAQTPPSIGNDGLSGHAGERRESGISLKVGAPSSVTVSRAAPSGSIPRSSASVPCATSIAVIDDRDPIAQPLDLFHVVRRVEQRHPAWQTSFSRFSKIAFLLCGSTPTVGSSRMRSSGSWRSAAARFSRRFMPPENSRTLALGPIREPDELQTGGDAFLERGAVEAVERAEERGGCRARRGLRGGRAPAGRSRVSVAPGRSRPRAACRRGEPLPTSGFSAPTSIEMVVVFPAPLGPRRPKRSPRFSENERSLTAVNATVALGEVRGVEHCPL